MGRGAKEDSGFAAGMVEKEPCSTCGESIARINLPAAVLLSRCQRE